MSLREEYRRAAKHFLENGDLDLMISELGIESSEHLDDIVRLLTGKEEERAIIIPSKSQGWFSIEDDHEYWPAYLELLCDPERKGLAKPAITIDRSTTDLMNRLFDPKDTENAQQRKYGLVVGYVQSGKTAHFTGFLAKAADAGFGLIVVLSGVYNDLREQTQARLCRELTGDLLDEKDNCDLRDVTFSKKWHLATHPGAKGDFHERRDTHSLEMITDDRPVLVVTKKNVSPLAGLISWFSGLSEEERSRTPLLLIDDECDFASINTSASPDSDPSQERDPNAINKHLREMLDMFQNYAYVGYTASPFANVFIHPDGDGTGFPTLYPRDFVISLPRPEGYQGFDSMFPGDGSTSPIRIVEEKEEDHDPDLEADIVRRWTSDPFRDPSANMTECPALQAALFDFIISGAIRRLRGQGEKHHSMLIHTKHTTNSMRPLKELVDDSVNTVWRRALIRSRTDKLRGSSREIYEGIRDHYEAKFSQDIDNPPEWDEVHEAIRELYRKGVDVLEVNHETGENLDYDMYPDGRTVIAIGGNRLSRGLTLEGLCVSYFIRSSQDPKADTMMQMGRWFGFRPGYSDLVRIYTTSNLNEHFDLIRQMEDSLRDDVERLESLGKTPDDFALRVMRAMNVRPTSDVKMQNVRISYYSFDSTILPKQGKFHFDDEARLRGNLTHVGSMLNNLDRENEATRVGGSWLWKGVGLEWAERLIAGLDLPNDGFKMADLKRYIDRRVRAGKGELANWSVALIGLNHPEGKPLPSTSKAMLGGKEIYTVKRTRLKGKNSVGFFPAPDDFVIDLDEPISKFKENGKLRYHLMWASRPSDQPLMLIYVIDKNSKAESSNREDLFEDGKGEHVVAVSIALPDADIPKYEIEAEREMWSNAYRPPMPDEEE